MKRTKSKMKTFFLGSVFGAIILAIISSAIWDKVGAPIFDNIFKFLLNISTLGLEKYRNTIYEEISKGFHENVSLEIYMLVTSIILGIIMTTIMVLLRIRKIQKDKTKTFKDIFKYPKNIIIK